MHKQDSNSHVFATTAFQNVHELILDINIAILNEWECIVSLRIAVVFEKHRIIFKQIQSDVSWIGMPR